MNDAMRSEVRYNIAIMMQPWPWILFAALAVFAIGLYMTSRRLGAGRVNSWVFGHRDHLPIPFLLIGIATRLLSNESSSWTQWRGVSEVAGVLLILLGESLRIWAVGIVGAATRSASTNAKRLVQEGPYAMIRNPIYAGNFLLCLGLACFTDSWVVVVACTLYFVIVYSRIIRAEERFLTERFGAGYEEFCRQVPRLVPRLRWPSVGLRASFSTHELRKEYQTIAGIVSAALLLHVIVLEPWRGWIDSRPRHRATAPDRGPRWFASASGWVGYRPHRGGLTGAMGLSRGAPQGRFLTEETVPQIASSISPSAPVITITLEQALQRSGVPPASLYELTLPPAGLNRVEANQTGKYKPGMLARMDLLVRREFPGTLIGALVFAGIYLTSNFEEASGSEFHDHLPMLASTALIGLAVRSLISQATVPAAAFEPPEAVHAWTLSPYVRADRGETGVGVLVRIEF